MQTYEHIGKQVKSFLEAYDTVKQDAVWASLNERFRHFWVGRVMAPYLGPIPDEECDQFIRILDRNAKGNRKDSEAVARAMVPQGAWRKIINRLHAHKPLGQAMHDAMTATSDGARAAAINEIYQLNAGDRNYLTGASGNAICAFLAAYDSGKNLSVISLRDRWSILKFLGMNVPSDTLDVSVGDQIVQTGQAIQQAARSLGLNVSARTISRFFYWPSIKPLWRDELTVKVSGRSVQVAIPEEPGQDVVGDLAAVEGGGDTMSASAADEVVRESMQIQGLLAKIGAAMGYSIWLPKSDRSRVLKVWQPRDGELLDTLPLGYDATTTKTIEQIDVLWLRRRSIARAFEVEHTTSIYSGLLRMADLIALQPDINVKLHIVANVDRQAKVMEEINRPVFAMLDNKPLREMCTFLSYDHIREIAELKHLSRLLDDVLEDYAIKADEDADGL